jgi:hypothetical protein
MIKEFGSIYTCNGVVLATWHSITNCMNVYGKLNKMFLHSSISQFHDLKWPPRPFFSAYYFFARIPELLHLRCSLPLWMNSRPNRKAIHDVTMHDR